MASIEARVAEHPQWYHTLELAPGVVTPGWFDLRGVVDAVGIPPSLTGLRCLDVATFDGFWAFTMEQRGASEVVGIDLLDGRKWDWPADTTQDALDAIAERKGAGEGFLIAKEALGSQVERLEMSVYDLDPANVGTFDFVYVGSLLLHLRDPVLALQRVRAVCAGKALMVDAIDPWLTALSRRPLARFDGKGRPWWWKPNLAALQRMIESAGFEVLGRPKRVMLPAGHGQERVPVRPGVLRHPEGRNALLLTRAGDPHGAILARPAV